jgi:hypothetical protein
MVANKSIQINRVPVLTLWTAVVNGHQQQPGSFLWLPHLHSRPSLGDPHLPPWAVICWNQSTTIIPRSSSHWVTRVGKVVVLNSYLYSLAALNRAGGHFLLPAACFAAMAWRFFCRSLLALVCFCVACLLTAFGDLSPMMFAFRLTVYCPPVFQISPRAA